jgi:DNA polymerase-3 subunit gamma/tau
MDHASIGEVTGTTITLAVTSAPIAKMISDEGNLSIVRDAVGSVVGAGWRVEVATVASTAQSGRENRGEPEPEPERVQRPVRPTRPARSAAPTPAGPPPAEDDGVDEESDAVEGAGGDRVDPEQAAMELLKQHLGAKPMER